MGDNGCLLQDLETIYVAAKESDDGQRCCVAPSPDLQERIRAQLETLRQAAAASLGLSIANTLEFREQRRVGFNDGLIWPGDALPLGAPPSVARSVAARSGQPLRGALHVVVVLVDFPDHRMTRPRQQFHDLFFSTGVVATGSVREYFEEVTGGLVTISGEVVGPYRLPRSMTDYADGGSGTQAQTPNARTMARDAARAANPDVDFTRYDNDGDGFVDAFVVVHAGRGAEETGRSTDIWSHKWVLDGGAMSVDASKVFAYLTVPEDAKLGVCAHELGHLLFGFPDLYDIDGTSNGVGDWCLMAGGSWLGGGNRPAHPSAWRKCQQGWVTQVNVTQNGARTMQDVKNDRTVLRLWRGGATSQEYFLAENRQRSGYDALLPGEGLLVWHIDDTIATNADELHPRVRLIQADGRDDLAARRNRGDGGDPFPGDLRNVRIAADTNPNSLSYGRIDTLVAISGITSVAGNISASINVRAAAKAKVSKKKNNKKKTEKQLTAKVASRARPKRRRRSPAGGSAASRRRKSRSVTRRGRA